MNKIIAAIVAWVSILAFLGWGLGWLREKIIQYVDDNYDDIDWNQ